MSERTVEDALVAAVDPIVPCYPLAALDNVPMPYCAYSLVFAGNENTMCGNSNLTNYRLRLDLYAETRAQLLALRDSVRDAVLALPGAPIPVAELDAYEPEIRGMRRVMDFSFWNARAA